MMAKYYLSLAVLGSLAMLVMAFVFQYVFDLAPCQLCIWQRWPHAGAGIIGLIIVAFGWRVLCLFGMVAVGVTGGIGIYHSGVEQKWWQGPNTCTTVVNNELSIDELLDQILAAPIVKCDEIVWQFMGMSMASWNSLISFGLCIFWYLAWRNWSVKNG